MSHKIEVWCHHYWLAHVWSESECKCAWFSCDFQYISCHQHISIFPVYIMLSTYKHTVRKTGPWSNKIKQMRKQNTEDTQYKRYTDLRGSPSVRYIHQRNWQVLPLLLSNKWRDTTYRKTRCNFLFFLSQSPLSEYNTHQHT